MRGPHRRMTRAIVALSASLALILGVATGVTALRWWQLRDVGTEQDRRFEKGAVVPDEEAGAAPLPAGRCSTDPCNFLILGSDSRRGLSPEEQERFGNDQQIGGENRADTIMLVHTDPNAEKAVILSFPRDLWVDIPGIGPDKINAAFEGGVGGGGPGLMAQTIANLSGLRVDHFLYVDLAGFQSIVDTLGGVTMCPPSYLSNPETGRIRDPLTGLDIRPGCQQMDGATALAFVRTRHLPCDAVPDFSRIGRQQQFLRAVINQMLRPGQVVRATGLVEPVLDSLKRDRGFLPGDLLYLVSQMQGLSTGAAEFRSVPGVAGWEGALSVVHMDPSAQRLFEAIDEGRPISEIGTELVNTPPSPATIEVAVIDAAGDGGAKKVETVLANSGFDVSPGIWAAWRTPTGIKAPSIAYRPGSGAAASVVAAYLPGMEVVESEALHGAEVAVVVPAGFELAKPSPDGGESRCPAA